MAFGGRGVCIRVFMSSLFIIMMTLTVVSVHSTRAPTGFINGVPPIEVNAAAPSMPEELLQIPDPDSGDVTPSAVAVEVSSRVVPTGPDPLHHNRKPNHKP